MSLIQPGRYISNNILKLFIKLKTLSELVHEHIEINIILFNIVRIQSNFSKQFSLI